EDRSLWSGAYGRLSPPSAISTGSPSISSSAGCSRRAKWSSSSTSAPIRTDRTRTSCTFAGSALEVGLERRQRRLPASRDDRVIAPPARRVFETALPPSQPARGALEHAAHL